MRMTNTKNSIRLRLSHNQLQAGLLALALLIAFFLVGCAPKSTAAASPSPTATASETIVEEDELPQDGGQLLLPMAFNPPTFNPLLVNTKELQAILSLVYEPLLKYDMNNRLSLSLAESWEPVDEQGLTWRIRLRGDVTWHNSSEKLTADDVVYTLDLLKSDEYKSSFYAANLNRIVAYTADDERTLLITSNSPGASVLHALAFPVVSRSRFSSGKIVGTGPYKVRNADKSIGIELEANERWWRQQPYIKNILAYAVVDNETALAMLSMHKLNFVPTSILTAGKYREEGVTKVFEIMTQQSEALLINHKRARLQDIRVRQAIAYALDRREIISKAYLNHAFSCDVPVPPDSWLYDSSSKVYDYNIEKAKEMLGSAGYKDRDGNGVVEDNKDATPLSFSLLVNDTPDNQVRKDVAQLIKAQLAKVGIEVDIMLSAWSTDKNEYASALEAGAFDLAIAGFNLDRELNLDFLLSTTADRNYGSYDDTQMEELLSNYRKAVADKDIKAAAFAIQKRFIEELPFIHLYFRTNSIVYTDSLKGLMDIRDLDILRTVEKWNFNSAGRLFFTGNQLSDLNQTGQNTGEDTDEDTDDNIGDTQGQTQVNAD